ncbi:hypothetical protein FKG94_07870 [Exilibacterium tricleocarpae]|uniref:Fibronectin type-III domain-containing protein n=1 Tax=Exilibacterium tricleocarpae TaxID=2591008 RepID=A0A545TZJ6_9GAMM|nr:fibronectin type III domain-containing protein [Exilibacterium tricleocarpae]TQV82636.1 hypothetical protein FKG94_07870 [Exilibacterium tricleocarpae]
MFSFIQQVGRWGQRVNSRIFRPLSVFTGSKPIGQMCTALLAILVYSNETQAGPWDNFSAPGNDQNGNFTVSWNGWGPQPNLSAFCVSREITAREINTNATYKKNISCNATSTSFSLIPGTYRYEGVVTYLQQTNPCGVCPANEPPDPLNTSQQTFVPLPEITAPEISEGFPVLLWDDYPGATEYRLQRRTISGPSGSAGLNPWVELYTGPTNNYVVTGVKLADGFHQFRVKTCRNTKCSGYSPVIEMEVIHTPNQPASISVPDVSPGSAVEIEWAASTGGELDRYEFFFCERQPGATDCLYQPYTVGTARTFLHENLNDDSQYRYRVRACSSFACSPFRTSGFMTAQVDPTEYLRRQLYYNKANDIDASEDGNQNQYARDLAAFRYLDLLYTVESGVVVNTYASGDATQSIDTLYGAAERARAANVEVDVIAALAKKPKHKGLKKLLLDIYHDRAVAEMLLYNEFIDRANIARLDGTPLAAELAELEAAFTTSDAALQKYFELFRAHWKIFLSFAESRRQLSPRYYPEGSTVAQDVASEVELFAGFKDVVLAYELLARVLESQNRSARLQALPPSGVADEATLSFYQSVLDDISSKEQMLRTILENNFQRELFDGEGNFFVSSGDNSGLAQTTMLYEVAVQETESTLAWMRGEKDYLGLPNDAAFIMQGPGGGGTADYYTFDLLAPTLEASAGPIETAIGAMETAKASYDNFRFQQDLLATEYTDRNRELNDTLFGLLGVEVGDLCAPGNDCVDIDDTVVAGSQIGLQHQNIELARLNLVNMQTQLENHIQRIRNEVEHRGTVAGINDALAAVEIKYGEDDIKLSDKIRELERKADDFNDVLTGISGAGDIALTFMGFKGFKDPFTLIKDVSSVAKGLSTVVKSIVGIGKERKIDDLETERQRLALAERAEINVLNAQMDDAAFVKTIKNLQLEVAVLELSIVQAQLAIRQELDRLNQMFSQAQRLISQILITNASLATRYFADPIHGRILTADMRQAERRVDLAKRWLSIAKSALEHKWQDTFSSLPSIAELRTAEDIRNFRTELIALNLGGSFGPGIEQAHDVFSIRNHVFGIAPDSAANTDFSHLLESHRHPDKLDWITLEFSTVKSIPPTFFQGPTVADNNPSCVLAAGTYRNKIRSVAVNLLTSHQDDGIPSPSVRLTYGGSSIRRTSTPGTVIATDEEGNVVGIEDEFVSTIPKFLVNGADLFVNSAQDMVFKDSFSQDMAASFNHHPENPTSQALKPIFVFKERSVAATRWRLSIKVGFAGSPIVDLSNVLDIELHFDHSYQSRFEPSQDPACDGGPLLLTPPTD